MKRTRAACGFATMLVVTGGAARADQLAWISEAQAEAAVAKLEAGSIVVSDEVGSLDASQEFMTFAAWRDAAKAFVTKLDSHVETRLHRVLQARLGFPAIGVTIEEMDDQWRSRLSLRKGKGAAFVDVDPGGPAATAGIRPGDSVVEIDGKRTKRAWDAARIVWERGPGAQLRLKLKRDDAERSVTLTTGAP